MTEVTGRLAVLVPTRGRPGNAERLIGACADTGTGAHLMFGVDDTDPELGAYRALAARHPETEWHVHSGEGAGMVSTLNFLATAAVDRFDTVAFLGDDTLPRTPGWDLRMLDELALLGTGMVYGDDRIQGYRLPTAIMMTADIPRTLGWMALPALRHLYVDSVWLALGSRTGRIRYLPDVVIEHLHPLAGTAPDDDGYRRVNGHAAASADRAAYERYIAGRLAADADAINTVADRRPS